ncbi:MAG: tetratricopeptide repeat protein [Bryobacteraceae bacterium]
MRVVFFALLAAHALEGAWIRVTSPHFEIVTPARERQARQLMDRLELIRHVFATAIGAKPAPLPVRVLLLGSEREYRAFRPSKTAAAFFQSGPERDYIVLSDMGEETLRAAFHEYVHLVLHHSAASLPRWLEEGTAEFYSTLTVSKTGRLLLGGSIPAHRYLLLREGLMSGGQLSSVGRGEAADDHIQAARFYAQSWALVHMLNLAPAWRRNLPRFAELLDRSVPPELAFEQAFSVPMERAMPQLQAYLRQVDLPLLEVMTGQRPSVDVAVEPMTDTAASLSRVEVLQQIGRSEEAQKLIEEAEKHDPGSVELTAAHGYLALARKQDREALRRFRQAIDGGSAPAAVYVEYAMLLRDTGAAKAEWLPFLREAATRNPKLAEAQFLLGLEAQRDGRHRDAIPLFEQATAVLPRQSYFWHALAISQHHMGNGEQARAAARRAAETAATTQEREMATSALRLVSEPEAARPATKVPPVTVPDSWQPKTGDTRIEGILEHIDCFGANARFYIRANGRSVALWVEKPGEILLRTASGITFDFSCGAQRPRRIIAGYDAAPDRARKTEGKIVSLEFP